jgi:hypothetical protein
MPQSSSSITSIAQTNNLFAEVRILWQEYDVFSIRIQNILGGKTMYSPVEYNVFSGRIRYFLLQKTTTFYLLSTTTSLTRINTETSKGWW